MKRVFGIVFCTAIAVAVLFAIAGTVSWWNAWIFLAFMVVIGLLTARLIKNVPGLAEERRSAAESARPWDLTVVRLINLALPVIALVSALEIRFKWFPSVPIVVSVCAFIMMIPASALTYRAIAVNPFFSTHVRIQEDRGHIVVSSGPYRMLRHPGYAGSIVFNLMVPLSLGSWAALVLAFGTIALLLYRTVKEDDVLLSELPAYAEYAKQVHYRLIPGVW